MKIKNVIGARSVPGEGADKCLYTVSVSLTAARDERIWEGYDWATRTFTSVVCIVGDGPLLARTGEIVNADPVVLEQRVATVTSRLQNVVLMSELAKEADFAIALSDVGHALATNETLLKSAARDARSYVQRVSGRGELAISESAAKTISNEYIALEMAMYLCMARRGYLVDVYAGGELGVLKDFIVGKFPGLLPELARRSFIGLLSESTS